MTTNLPEGRKLGFKMKAGYAIGQFSDSIGFNVFYFFFLYFLTDFAGIPAGIAGTISLIAVTWDAVTDPIVGYISDNLHSKNGRRRPMMLVSLIPYSLCTFLLFNNVDFGENAKFVYFVVIAILFWSSYKIFVIPYFALGAELTDDFNERTSLRVWASVCMYLAVIIASAAPPMILEIAEKDFGLNPDQAWNCVGVLLAAIIALTIIVCYISTKGGELATQAGFEPNEKIEGNPVKQFIVNIGDILNIKPVKYLVFTVLFWAVVSSMVSGGLMYLMMYNLGYDAALQSTCFLVMGIAAIAWLPFINFSSVKFDKQKIYFITMVLGAIGMILFNFIGFPSLIFLIIFLFVFQFGNSTFWTLYYSMMYDISELDEFVTGNRREGCIAALMSFAQKLGAAIPLFLTGQILQFGGYDGALDVQSDAALSSIMAVNTWVPGIIGLVAGIIAFFYPLTRPKFNALMKSLLAKRNNEPYTTEGFDSLLNK